MMSSDNLLIPLAFIISAHVLWTDNYFSFETQLSCQNFYFLPSPVGDVSVMEAPPLKCHQSIKFSVWKKTMDSWYKPDKPDKPEAAKTTQQLTSIGDHMKVMHDGPQLFFLPLRPFSKQATGGMTRRVNSQTFQSLAVLEIKGVPKLTCWSWCWDIGGILRQVLRCCDAGMCRKRRWQADRISDVVREWWRWCVLSEVVEWPEHTHTVIVH